MENGGKRGNGISVVLAKHSGERKKEKVEMEGERKKEREQEGRKEKGKEEKREERKQVK